MDGWMDGGRTGGWMDRSTDRQIDRQERKRTSVHCLVLGCIFIPRKLKDSPGFAWTAQQQRKTGWNGLIDDAVPRYIKL